MDGSSAHPVKQVVLLRGAGRKLPGGSGEEPVGCLGSDRRFGQAVIDFAEVIAGPCDQVRAESVVGADGSCEIPGMNDGVGGPDGKRLLANGLALDDLPGVEQVELDFPYDVGDAGLAGFPGGEVAGFL
jgi:hypothetical protein